MSEHDHQAAFFDWAGRQRIDQLELMHAIPNGGARHMTVAAKLKAEGVKAGALDVQWPVARGGFIGLAIEFKYADGNPTKEQRERCTKLQMAGWLVVFVWDWMGAARTVQGYAGMVRVETL